MSVKIKDINRIPELKKALKELSKYQVRIGIFGEKDSEILMIAKVNEFGWDIKVTPKMRGYLSSQGLHLKKDTKKIKIPERSFIRNGYDLNIDKIEEQVKKAIESVILLGITPKQCFDLIGKITVGLIQDYLRSVKDPPNHPFTIKQKGSTGPLRGKTSRLVDAIDHKVVKA